jgi:hypothetical protein
MALNLSAARYLVAIALTLGCSGRSLSFGDEPQVLWWTDHETGDLSDWIGKSGGGGFVLNDGPEAQVVEGIARSGRHALLINDDSPTQRVYPLVARNGPLPLGIYASAWYYVPEALHPTSYWWFVLYRSRHPPYDSQSFRDEIHLSFTSRPDGTMGSTLETEELGTIAPLVEREIPVARWFHVETYLRATDGTDGEFKVWQDGELTYQVAGKMMETTWAEWMTGGVVDGLTSEASELYIDDAALSQRRLGPLPLFTRQ